MTILGIDPGYAIVGFGVLSTAGNKPALVRCGAINTPAGMDMPQRLLQIAMDLELLIGQFKPDVMAIEELYFNHNITTGIGVALFQSLDHRLQARTIHCPAMIPHIQIYPRDFYVVFLRIVHEI